MRQQQAIGALLICLITAIIAAAIVLIPRWFNSQTPETNAFAVDSILADSLRKQWEAAHPQYKYNKKHKPYPKYTRNDTVKIQMQYFDPNTADSLTLLRVGLKPWQAKGILHYRAKGGQYRKPEDLRKLYGMTDSIYQTLEPWIQIENTVDTLNPDSIKAEFARVGHEKKDTILELNRADSLDLQYIRGIGPVVAKKIVFRRDALGGFYQVQQLAEIQSVLIGLENTGWTLDSLYAHFTVDTTFIRLLNVNHTAVKYLTKHPYISYDQAKMLDDLRHRRTIKSENDLLKYGIFSRVELDHLRPYLSYDK